MARSAAGGELSQSAASADNNRLDEEVLAIGDAPARTLTDFHQRMTAALADAVKVALAAQQNVSEAALAATAKSVEIIYGVDLSPLLRASAATARQQKDA